MAKKTLNNGEWGETYVLLRLLGDGRIALADENEQEIEGSFLEVISALKKEKLSRQVRYSRAGYLGDYYQILITVNDEPAAVSRSDLFAANADHMRDIIQSSKGASYPMPDEIVEFFESIQIGSHKATSAEKSDIYVTAQDPRSGTVRKDLGYSIKTKWGKPSTLFNYGTNGNRSIYRLIGDVDSKLAKQVNSIVNSKGKADVRRRWNALAEHGVKFEFFDYAYAPDAKCHAFSLTLDLISPYTVPMFEKVVRSHFETGTPQAKCPIPDVHKWLVENNPSGVKRPEIQYEYLLKTFLYASHCGMTASKPWNGRSEVNGGLITVDKNGHVLAFNALDGDVFKEFLFTHTNLDFPSTQPKKGNYGYVYWNEELDCWCFDLSFQIRYNDF